MLKSDSFIGKFMADILDQMILNFLFLLCCLPIVTAPAAICGLFSAELAIHRGEEPNAAALFFRSLRRNFRQALAGAALLIAAALPAAALWFACIHWELALPAILHWVLVFVEFSIFAVGCWFFPLTARFENTLRATLSNAVFLCFSFFPTTLLLIVIALGGLGLFAVMPGPMLLGFTGYLVFFSFSVGMRLAVIPLSRVFGKLSPEEDTHENE